MVFSLKEETEAQLSDLVNSREIMDKYFYLEGKLKQFVCTFLFKKNRKDGAV